MNGFLAIDLKSTDVSTGTLIGISFAGIIGAAILLLMLKMCINCERRTGKMSFSWVKIILIGIGPALISSKSFLNTDIDLKIGLIITAVAVVISFIWNMLTYGIIYGVMFTILQALGGFLGGISVVAVVAVILFALIVYFTGADSSTPDDPEEVYDVRTNEVYRLEKTGNGYYICVDGTYIPVRHDDYGDWIDDYGNRYKK